jgi:hypothetical protein
MDRIAERLRTAAEGVERATQMMADAKSARNNAAGDVDAKYAGLSKERTAEWHAADILEAAYRWRRAFHHGTREEIEIQEQCLLAILAEHPEVE